MKANQAQEALDKAREVVLTLAEAAGRAADAATSVEDTERWSNKQAWLEELEDRLLSERNILPMLWPEEER